MASYILKTIVGNQFDKVAKELSFSSDKSEDRDVDDSGISAGDILAEQKKQKAAEKEMNARHAQVAKEREEARQKIRDKYNIKKKGEPASTHTVKHEPVHPPAQASTAQNQGFDRVKTNTNAFNSLKEKFGWK